MNLYTTYNSFPLLDTKTEWVVTSNKMLTIIPRATINISVLTSSEQPGQEAHFCKGEVLTVWCLSDIVLLCWGDDGRILTIRCELYRVAVATGYKEPVIHFSFPSKQAEFSVSTECFCLSLDFFLYFKESFHSRAYFRAAY